MNLGLTVVFVEVVKDDYLYERFAVGRRGILKFKLKRCRSSDDTPSKCITKLLVDGILLHYFVRELNNGPVYCNSFVDKFHPSSNGNINTVEFSLVPVEKDIVDYGWNYRMTYLLRERCELEHTLSWLSTLGGAFSALGDYSSNCAEIAGKISLNQLKLAFRMGDANVVARCRLYLSLSLIQQHYFKLAKKIVLSEYNLAKNDVVVDIRLINMCKGIWCKLKYEYDVYKNCRKINLL